MDKGVLKNERVIGVCGRQGAGKSSISSRLTGSAGQSFSLVKVYNPFEYIVDTIFGFCVCDEKDLCWGMTRREQEEMVRKMITEHVDSQWFEKHKPGEGPVDGSYMAPFDYLPSNAKWVEMSFAWSLKKICSVIFDLSFEMLLGLTDKAREERERVTYNHLFNRIPDIPFTGRVALEYFGTNVMRNLFDVDIWLKILKRDMEDYCGKGMRVIIPDVRFENEIRFLQSIGAPLLVVCRDEKDLILTDEDRKTHPAKWHFLEYYKCNDKYYVIQNNQSLECLFEKVEYLVNY